MTPYQRKYLDAVRREDGLTALALLMNEIERVTKLPSDDPEMAATAQAGLAEAISQMRATIELACKKIEAGGTLTLNEAAMIGVIGVQLGRIEAFAYAAALPMAHVFDKGAHGRPN